MRSNINVHSQENGLCIIKIHVPRAHEVKNQCVIAKRNFQIMKYGQDVIIKKWTDVNIQYGKWY